MADDMSSVVPDAAILDENARAFCCDIAQPSQPL